MGTTGVLLIYHRGKITVGWVGDSRAYLSRGEQLQPLTRDHSAIHYLLDKGSITQAEADQADSKHILARAVGSKKTVEVDCLSQSVQSGDVLMLSTDGLHDYLPDAILSRYISQFVAGKKVTETLVNLSIAQGSQDNISLLIARLI